MVKLLVWMAVIELAFLVFGMLAASALQMEKRSRFWLRVLLGSVAIVSSLLLIAVTVRLNVLPEEVLGPAWLGFIVAALTLAPVCCYRRAGRSDAGGGWGPRQAPQWPSSPYGGLPLPDAEQARVRVRDHNRPRLRDAPRRRRVSRTT